MDPLAGRPRLDLVIRGVRRQYSTPTRVRLPITPLILRAIRQVLSENPTDFDSVAVWAACCLGFFGFLRSGEFTIPTRSTFDSRVHLTPQDVALDSHSHPTTMRVHIKASKTDQYRQGVLLYLAATGNDLCPVAAVAAYLARRPPVGGPLFLTAAGTPLTKPKLIALIRDTLQRAGIQAAAYSGHSFRIGAATTAAARGIPETLIKTLGRWSSDAYQTYIQIPPDQLAPITRALGQQ